MSQGTEQNGVSASRKRPAKPTNKGSSFPPFKKKSSDGGKQTEGSKPDWKKMRQERKALKETRKKKEMKPDFYQATKKAKEIWEEMRKSTCPEDARTELCEKLYKLIKEDIKRFSHAHDLTRILESLLVHGSEKIRNDIYEQFKAPADTISLMTSKYGHFIAIKLLKYTNPGQKTEMLANIQPRIANLLKNRYASNVINEFYLNYAKATQKSTILRQCYGHSLQTITDPSDELKIIFKEYPEKKPHIMKYVSEMTWARSLDPAAYKNNVILQRLLYEYIENCEPSECAPVMEIIKGELGSIYNTMDGSLLAMSCLWRGSPKDRKVIVKSLKGLVPKIACDKFGYKMLLALFDAVDDTVLVSKAICSEITNNLNEIIMNEFGQRVLVYLIAHRVPNFFDPMIVKHLEVGDTNSHTKKPVDLRLKDISEGMFSFMINGIADNFGIWLQDNSACLVVKFILERFADKSMDSALIKIAESIAEASTENGIERKAVDDLVRFIMTKLSNEQATTFASKLIECLDGCNEVSQLDEWLKTNRGCFVLLRILEICDDSSDVVKQVKTLVQENDDILLENDKVAAKLLRQKGKK